MKQYAIYLRKSRADVEAEARGEGETLARHRAALTALAEHEAVSSGRQKLMCPCGFTLRFCRYIDSME